MKLIVSDHCPFSMRCILVLMEKNINFDLEVVDLTRKDEFLHKLSPYARVPVLVHSGRSIYESSVINEYLEDINPEPALLPESAYARANARFWIDYCNTRFMPAYFNLLKSGPGQARDRLRAELLESLGVIEQAGLSQQGCQDPYWLGETPGLVDFTFWPFFERFADVEVYRDVEIPANLKHLNAWLGQMRTRSSVRKLSKTREHYIDYFRPYYAD